MDAVVAQGTPAAAPVHESGVMLADNGSVWSVSGASARISPMTFRRALRPWLARTRRRALESNGGRRVRRPPSRVGEKQGSGQPAATAASFSGFFALASGGGGQAPLSHESIAAADRLPSPMARITVAAPRTMSPPANTPGRLVMP